MNNMVSNPVSLIMSGCICTVNYHAQTAKKIPLNKSHTVHCFKVRSIFSPVLPYVNLKTKRAWENDCTVKFATYWARKCSLGATYRLSVSWWVRKCGLGVTHRMIS